MDGYLQSQTTVARRGRLIVGSYLPRYDADSGQVNWALAALAGGYPSAAVRPPTARYAWTPPG